MSHVCSSDTAFFTTPRHDGCGRSEAAFEDFIPSDDLFTMLFGQVFLHALNEIALQLFFGRMVLVGFQTFLSDALLAERAFFPA